MNPEIGADRSGVGVDETKALTTPSERIIDH
jgi:hypothetical protein